jgi:PAS domain S-box-containing protein
MAPDESSLQDASNARLIDPPHFPGDPERTRRARALHVLLLTIAGIIVLIFTIGIPFVFTNKSGAALIGAAMAAFTASGWFLTRRGLVLQASWLLVVCAFWLVTGVMLFGGGLGSVAPLGYLAVITSAVWLLGSRGGALVGIASVAAALATAVAASLGFSFPRLLPFQPLTSWVYLTFVVATSGLPMVFAIRDLEAALKEVTRASAMTNTIVDSMPGLFAKLDGDGRLIRFNARVPEVTGLPPTELLNRPARFLIADQDQEAAASALQQCFAEGTAIRELSIRTADGSLSPHLFYGARLRVEGEPRAVFIGLNLQERRQAEQALRRFEERYREFLERVRFAALTTGKDLQLEFANDYFEKLSGWSRADLIGQPFLRFIEQGDITHSIEALRSVLDGREALAEFQTRLIRKDGRERVIQWNVSAISGPDGRVRGATCLGVDLTERHELQAQLLQSQKLESLGRLAAGIAHDFNNILTIIAGFAEMIQSPAVEADERERALSEILDATQRASALTRQLLAFSRKQMLSPQVVDLNEVVSESRRLLSRLLGADIQLRTSLCPSPLAVLADPGQLHQVLMNLAVNSRDAMPCGGTLTISTFARGEMQELVVSDSGHGMDEATVQRAFEPFFTTKEPGQGSGLGLAMVYGIVEQSRGTIHIESAIGRGTTVVIRLPAVEPATRPEPSGAAPPERRPARLLLVEDEPGVRNLVCLLLRDSGHAVIPAADGPSALEEAERASFQFDAAVVDVVMPYMTGPELVGKLRSQLPELPVVFMSGFSNTPPAEIQALSGHTEFVQKPFKPEDLLGAIDRVLA